MVRCTLVLSTAWYPASSRFVMVLIMDKSSRLDQKLTETFLQASVNHQKVAGGFAEAIEDITARLKTIKTSVEISESMDMKFLVVDLYVEVFDFLCWTMKWYQKRGKRFRKSFNKNYATKVQEKVSNIRQTIDRIGFAAEQATQMRVKHLDETASSIKDDVNSMKQYLQETSDRSRNRVPGEEEMEQFTKLIEMGILGRNSLLATGQHWEYGAKTSHPALKRALRLFLRLLRTQDTDRHVKIDHKSQPHKKSPAKSRQALQSYRTPRAVRLKNWKWTRKTVS